MILSATCTSGKAKAIPGTTIHHISALPAHIIVAYFKPTIYPIPNTAAPVLILNTNFAFSASVSPHAKALVVNVSAQVPNVAMTKSYNPPIIPAKSNGFTCPPSPSPEMSTCVLAVASGKGYLPCISLTKNLRKGIINNIPSTPPSKDAMNTFIKSTVMSGYFAWRMYNAGNVKMAPATTIPEHAPMLWIMTFSPNALLRCVAPAKPTAMMVMGIAASNT